MTFPFALPDWLPWWAPTLALVVVLLWVLAFLLVPFSVIGLKARLEGLEARLDEIQAEIRGLTLRLPAASVRPVEFDETYAAPPDAAPPRRQPFARPPIPPATHELEEGADRDVADKGMSLPTPPAPGLRARSPRPPRDERTEPKLDWPR